MKPLLISLLAEACILTPVVSYAGSNADTITADEIWEGVSSAKTEVAQVDWWDAYMKDKVHTITGTVTDVRNGTFSGYWVVLMPASVHPVTVSCGLTDASADAVRAIHKGDTVTCHGEVDRTWFSLGGNVLNFNMEGEITRYGHGRQAPDLSAD